MILKANLFILGLDNFVKVSQNPNIAGIPERSKGSDCKSDGFAFEGSNPSPSNKKRA